MGIIQTPSNAEWADSYKYINLNTGIRMAYMEFGNTDKPPLIMIHGYSDTARICRSVAKNFADDYHIYAVDLRGHGKTDKPKCFAYTILQHAEDILSFADLKGIDSFYLIGASMGSMISQTIAFSAPDRVIKLALIATGARFHHSPEEVKEFDEMFTSYSVEAPPLEEWYPEAKSAEDTSLFEYFYQDVLSWPDYCWKAAWWGMELLDNTAFLQFITAPVIALWGTEDPIFPEEYQKEVMELLPDAKFVFFDGLGHDLSSLIPEKVSSHILDFFKA